MLSGYPPFYDNEPIGIYKKILERKKGWLKKQAKDKNSGFK